jgi:hypothetical protein
MQHGKRLWIAMAGMSACMSLAACGSSRRDAPPAPDVSDTIDPVGNVTPQPCTDAEVRGCSITLGEHNGVLNCYHGQQVCAEGVWGSCGSGEVQSLPAPGEKLRGTPGARLLAVTGAVECTANPCDPSCLEIEAEDGDGTSTVSGDTGSYAWQTGTLSGFPSGLVKKGLVEPCTTGSDCQFNTRCQYPSSSTCGHNMCATGGTLDASCNSCVEAICEEDPTCCGAPPADVVCAHDPCAQGAALNSTCDSCVTAICADRPSCCTGTWDALCVAAVTTTCGYTCSCRAGEKAYNGSCYYKEEADQNWTESRTDCQARGTGWDLLSIRDSAENTFVVSNVIDDSETWIGFTDAAAEGTWRWANSSPAGAWYEAGSPLIGNVTAYAYGSSWKYNATNVDPGATWIQPTFNDASWPAGVGELGFGDGDEDTVIAATSPSYYFRRVVNLSKLPTAATLSVLFDDGFIAYVNGTEVSRENISGTTHASASGNTNNENRTNSTAVSVTPFRVGDNLIAIVVKNRATTTDVSFDSQLVVTYGPDRPIPYGSTWRYYAAAASPGAGWEAPGFNDATWSSGAGQFGFGESDQATTFALTTGSSYYFRKTFTLAETVNDASLQVTYDDGFVAYLNGTEVMRRDVTGVAHTDFATDSNENQVDTESIATSAFVVGQNVLAVVVKNASSSTDLSFDARLDTTLSGSTLYENFPAGEPDGEDCAIQDANRTGLWADKRCNQNTDSVCEGPATQMTGNGGQPLSGAWTPIEYGSTWKYRANTTSPGNGWELGTYNDSAWSTGAGQLGYGNSDEATTFAAANPSYYFRKTINVPTEISDATLSLVFDDGFVAYVNGVEVLRRNVVSTAHTSYSSASSSNNETVSVQISKDAFVQGNNTLAVVVKNTSNTSSDISFDLKLQVTLCGIDGCPPEPEWSQSCVDRVATVCDATCDTRDPPRSTGQCVPWFPGETDPTCSGIDLTVGVPCTDNIPVCNHGTVTAPAGITIAHFPANSQQFPTCSPNMAHPSMKTCVTTQPIPPGQCIDVTGCPGLIGNREIMVNPAGAGSLPECSCQDNWGLYSNGECGVPSCDGGSSVATLQKKPVDIVVVIDNSGSMQGEIEQVQERINDDFAAILEASGVDYRVIMMSRYGDVDTAVGGSDYPICVSSPLGGHDCSNPIAQGVRHNPGKFYHFSTDVGSLDGLCRIIQGFNSKDELASDTRTWTPVAPNGYKSLLRPEARKAFLVITDDRVSCSYGGYTFNDLNTSVGGHAVASAFDAALLTLSPEQFGTAANRNYVFHSIVAMSEFVPGAAPWPSTQPISTGKCTPGSEAPGTGYQGLSILTGGLRYPTCRNSDFNAIFQAVAEEVIEGASVSCTVQLEDNAEADPDSTTVHFVPGGSVVPTIFSRVANASACTSNAYYYENDTTITLCPLTCTMVQADLAGSLGVEVGCSSTETYQAAVLQEVYESECAEDTRVQWGFLTYNATTPGNSNVVFKIRTAPTEAELTSATWIDLARAQASPDTQVCGFGGPAPCPIDLYTALGGSPAAHHPFAEVQVVLNPTGDGKQPSTIQGWQLNYSCPFAQ